MTRYIFAAVSVLALFFGFSAVVDKFAGNLDSEKMGPAELATGSENGSGGNGTSRS